MYKQNFLLLRLAFLISVLSMAGSLFFSEVMKLPPCVLCWYQRICMYPLVFIFLVGLVKAELDCFKYASGLLVAGLGIAIYHNLLYYKILPESIAPCAQGVSCTSRQVEWFGFLTIPLLSLAAFTILFTLTIYIFRQSQKETQL